MHIHFRGLDNTLKKRKIAFGCVNFDNTFGACKLCWQLMCQTQL